jgi:hypothetical protein
MQIRATAMDGSERAGRAAKSLKTPQVRVFIAACE